MRIVAGSLGGRSFQSPKSHRTHPMSERARGALFNMLGNIEGLTVLDAFAGSGALSLEALSRGASHVIAIDIDRGAISTIHSNAQDLGVEEQLKATRANVGSWSDNNPDKKFDLVVLDPPHDKLQLPVVQKLVHHVGSDGLLVLSWPGKQKAPQLEDAQLIAAKSHGDMQLVTYRRLS